MEGLTPYMLIAFILVVTRIGFGLKELLSSIKLTVPNVLGIDGLIMN